MSVNPPPSPWPREDPRVDVGASALTCHVGFLKPLAASDKLSKRLEAINKLLQSIHVNYNITPIQLLDENNLVSVVNTPWRSIPVTLRFVLHRELVSLAYYIHADHTLQSIVSKVTNYFTTMTGCSCNDLQISTALQNLHEFLYVTIWDQFFKENPIIPAPSASWPFPEELENPYILGNFRGIIIVNNHYLLGFDHIVQNERIVKSLQPFLCSTQNVNIDDFTICMMEDRALYISILAKLPSDPPHYVLFSNNLSPRRFGELVANGHRLGIFRFAALVPRAVLGQAAHVLYQIETELDLILNSLSENAPVKAMQDRIENISGRFAELNNLFVGKGARNRLRQSQRYKESFDDLIRSLRISSFEMYNPYDDATSKALSPTLISIAQLLSDYDNIFDNYCKLRQIVSAEATAKRNAEIAGLQHIAEWALFILLGPYYGAMITTHLLRIDEREVPVGWFSMQQVVFAICLLLGLCLAGVRAVTTWVGRDEKRAAAIKSSRLKLVAAIKSCFCPVPVMLMMIAVLLVVCLHVFSVGD